MSYYLNIYMVDHEAISNLMTEELAEIKSKLAKTLSESEELFLSKLLEKNFQRDPETWESPDASGLISSLEVLCEVAAGKKSSIEFYLDEDQLPDLWSFSINDWDTPDDFKLPICSEGTPSVVYRDNRSLEEYRHRFKAMIVNNEFDENCISKDSLSDLADAVGASVEARAGLFVFCKQ